MITDALCLRDIRAPNSLYHDEELWIPGRVGYGRAEAAAAGVVTSLKVRCCCCCCCAAVNRPYVQASNSGRRRAAATIAL